MPLLFSRHVNASVYGLFAHSVHVLALFQNALCVSVFLHRQYCSG